MARQIGEEQAIKEILGYLRTHGMTEAEELAQVLDLPLSQVKEALVEIDHDELRDLEGELEDED